MNKINIFKYLATDSYCSRGLSWSGLESGYLRSNSSSVCQDTFSSPGNTKTKQNWTHYSSYIFLHIGLIWADEDNVSEEKLSSYHGSLGAPFLGFLLATLSALSIKFFILNSFVAPLSWILDELIKVLLLLKLVTPLTLLFEIKLPRVLLEKLSFFFIQSLELHQHEQHDTSSI